MAKKDSAKNQLPILPETEGMSALDPQKEPGRVLQHPPHQRTQVSPCLLSSAVLTKLNPLSLEKTIAYFNSTIYYVILNQ